MFPVFPDCDPEPACAAFVGFGAAMAFGVSVILGAAALVGAGADTPPLPSVSPHPEKHVTIIPNAINTALNFLQFIFSSS